MITGNENNGFIHFYRPFCLLGGLGTLSNTITRDSIGSGSVDQAVKQVKSGLSQLAVRLSPLENLRHGRNGHDAIIDPSY